MYENLGSSNKGKDRLDRIEEKLDMLTEEKVIKKDKTSWGGIPWMARTSKKQAQEGYVSIMLVGDNRSIKWFKVKIDEQTAIVDGIPRVITADDIIFYKKNPTVIIPSWNTHAWNPSKDYEKAKTEGTTTQGIKLIINRMEKDVLASKLGMSPMTIIIGLVILGAVCYLAYKGGYI